MLEELRGGAEGWKSALLRFLVPYLSGAPNKDSQRVRWREVGWCPSFGSATSLELASPLVNKRINKVTRSQNGVSLAQPR